LERVLLHRQRIALLLLLLRLSGLRRRVQLGGVHRRPRASRGGGVHGDLGLGPGQLALHGSDLPWRRATIPAQPYTGSCTRRCASAAIVSAALPRSWIGKFCTRQEVALRKMLMHSWSQALSDQCTWSIIATLLAPKTVTMRSMPLLGERGQHLCWNMMGFLAQSIYYIIQRVLKKATTFAERV
jgi:hypothetical protein